MSEARINFEYCDQLVEKFEQVCEHPIRSKKKDPIYYTGVDPGPTDTALFSEKTKPPVLLLRITSSPPSL